MEVGGYAPAVDGHLFNDVFGPAAAGRRAAVHAGVVNPVTGGTVAVVIKPGQDSYSPSTRNGVSTSGYGSWGVSYSFEDPQTAANGDQADRIQNVSIHWTDSAVTLYVAERIGQSFTYVIPPLPAGMSQGRVWGTDIYTSDSSIAWAAVHAGLIQTATGGAVTVAIMPGLRLYVGTPRNGVTSANWGAWGAGFGFVQQQ
jgi:hypothetical protein